ncbi:MAG: DEAD/DEAH box helicase family protein [Bacteroidaceae bacterium]|nr:DEAD/DEAH box helicase family protein [Bacteroidaceae bacterium]
MFYKLIEKKRNEWLSSPDCTVKEVIRYIEQRGKMRDAQIDAIKTFLYLKIVCGNQPLKQLFLQGFFNTLDIREESLTDTSRNKLLADKAAAALYEYSKLKRKNGEQVSPKLEEYIKTHAETIDYDQIISKIFYDVDYTDYLYSLPMGAGKTYLMAAFIYLDLYFAQNEPDNPVFAHNFMIFAPSGLKTSILPSLKNIMRFDPSWILPEETAIQLKRQVKFEVLDEANSAKGSNIIKNPNAQKINTHLLSGDTFGLVAITNAEKVILNRAENDLLTLEQLSMFPEDERNLILKGKELRRVIGNIPHLAIFVDEVHHVADGDIKLRKVINQWTESQNFKYMLGFSGTPFLETADKISVSEELEMKNQNLSNVVCHYALVDAVANFLKNPIVKHENADLATIIDNGVRDFFKLYKDTVYQNGTCAKQAIYCPNIKTLEEIVYPQVANLVAEYGYAPNSAILKFYSDSNSSYKLPKEAQVEFDSLDSEISKVRIILLVGIGKEGWDCRSLTSVILPMKGSCAQNKVMQTSCRCLREVDSNDETALIWLNNQNAKVLNDQLKKFQETDIDELNKKQKKEKVVIQRHSRMDTIELPPIEYMQFCVIYTPKKEEPKTHELLSDEHLLVKRNTRFVHSSTGFSVQETVSVHEFENNLVADFKSWLYEIERESFRTLTHLDLLKFESELQDIFIKITIEKDGQRFYNNEYAQQRIRSKIRQAFAPICTDEVTEKTELREAKLMWISPEDLEKPLETSASAIYYPDAERTSWIMEEDMKIKQIDKIIEERPEMEEILKSTKPNLFPERNFTYHYLPYHFDSNLERNYFADQLIALLKGDSFKDLHLEVYFNGDDTISDFGIECYKQVDGVWQRIQHYYPDFLMLQRGSDGKACRVLIIETKGKVYEDSFKDKEAFMKKFISDNSEHFDFLYLKESQITRERPNYLLEETINKINSFFKD